MKKGQISIFIIIGVTLMIIIGLYISIMGNQDIEQVTYTDSPEIDTCLKFVGSEAVTLSAIRGGDINQEHRSGNITAIRQDNQNLMKSRSEIENQLAGYIDQNIKKCIEQIFPDYARNTMGDPESTVSLYPGNMMVELHMPMTIIQGETVQNPEWFRSEVSTSYLKAIETAENIVQSRISTGMIDETMLIQSGFDVKLLEQNTIVILESPEYEFVAVV